MVLVRSVLPHKSQGACGDADVGASFDGDILFKDFMEGELPRALDLVSVDVAAFTVDPSNPLCM